VQAGEVLVELDSTDQRLQVEEERQRLLALEAHRTARHQEGAAVEAAWHATAQGAQATLDEARARHHDAVVALQAAQEKAQRLGPLAPLTALLSQQTAVDTTRQAVQRLEHAQQVHAAEWRARLAQAQREAVVVDGEIATVTAHLARLAHALEVRHLRAPMAGRLGAVALVQPGAFVHEGERLAVIGPSEAPMVTAEVAPAVARGRLRPGQPAWLRITGVPGMPSWSLTATVMQVAAAGQEEHLRVVLRLAPNALAYWPLQPSVTGTMAVEVERVAPVTLVVRALGQRLWGHAQAPTPPVLPGEGL
jgi:membrane fusion protein (multidrug efflux system)